MAANKKSILLYVEWISIFEELTDEEAGKLVKHLFRYVNDKNPEAQDRLTKLLFEPIKQQLKRDLKKYEAICERNKANGEKGGRPKSESNPNNPGEPSGLISNPNNPAEPDKEEDKDKDKDKEIFNIFRLAYRGTKRGLDTEYANFIKRNNAKILVLLLPALKKEIIHRQRLIDAKQFCPGWKNLQTWINQKCWEQEFPDVELSHINWGGSHETHKQEFKEI